LSFFFFLVNYEIKRRRTKPAMPTSPVPSMPSVPGSGTAGGVAPVTAKPVRAQPLPCAATTQRWMPKPVSWLMVTLFRVNVTKLACVWLVLSCWSKLNEKLPIVPFVFRLLVPIELPFAMMLVKVLRVVPEVTFTSRSPPLSFTPKPAFITIVTSTLLPFWLSSTVPYGPAGIGEPLLVVRVKQVSPAGQAVAKADGARARATNAKARTESLKLVNRTTSPLVGIILVLQ